MADTKSPPQEQPQPEPAKWVKVYVAALAIMAALWVPQTWSILLILNNLGYGIEVLLPGLPVLWPVFIVKGFFQESLPDWVDEWIMSLVAAMLTLLWVYMLFRISRRRSRRTFWIAIGISAVLSGITALLTYLELN
jgi:branched-subunit amino acid transport protein